MSCWVGEKLPLPGTNSRQALQLRRQHPEEGQESGDRAPGAACNCSPLTGAGWAGTEVGREGAQGRKPHPPWAWAPRGLGTYCSLTPGREPDPPGDAEGDPADLSFPPACWGHDSAETRLGGHVPALPTLWACHPDARGQTGPLGETLASRGSCAPRGVRAGARRSAFSPCLPGPGLLLIHAFLNTAGLIHSLHAAHHPQDGPTGAGAAECPQRRKPDQRAGVLTCQRRAITPSIPRGVGRPRDCCGAGLHQGYLLLAQIQ